MPFIKKDQMTEDFKRAMNKDLRDNLRKSLSDPTLSDYQKGMIRALLEAVGKPKVYDPNTPPKQGAIKFQ
jgi:hypothetical protein